jgi:hypothetical protein
VLDADSAAPSIMAILQIISGARRFNEDGRPVLNRSDVNAGARMRLIRVLMIPGAAAKAHKKIRALSRALPIDPSLFTYRSDRGLGSVTDRLYNRSLRSPAFHPPNSV